MRTVWLDISKCSFIQRAKAKPDRQCKLLRLTRYAAVQCFCDYDEAVCKDKKCTNCSKKDRENQYEEWAEWSVVDTNLFALTDGFKFCLFSYCDRCSEYQFEKVEDITAFGNRVSETLQYSPPTGVGSEWDEHDSGSWEETVSYLGHLGLNSKDIFWSRMSDFKLKGKK
jgi:hypothetical protein